MDCALAELYIRGLSVERLVKDQHQAEIFNSIYTRMSEVCAPPLTLTSSCSP